MANPSYGIDVVAVAVAVVLAAAIVLLAYQVVPDLTDLMMMPPPIVWDAPDDDTHYRVNYFGYCATTGVYIQSNELHVKIVGS
jgi:hypothetical protein